MGLPNDQMELRGLETPNKLVAVAAWVPREGKFEFDLPLQIRHFSIYHEDVRCLAPK